MAKSEALSVEEYLSELPPERREAISAVRQVILEHLPAGFVETMQYGMISYVVPLETYPETYNGSPLAVASLASQKNHMAVYLMNTYGDPETERWFTERYRATGKRLDMGKSCVRFRKLDDLPIELIGEAVARTPLTSFIRMYEDSRRASKEARRK